MLLMFLYETNPLSQGRMLLLDRAKAHGDVRGKMQVGYLSTETGTTLSLLAFPIRNRIQMNKLAFRFMCPAQLEVIMVIQAGHF